MKINLKAGILDYEGKPIKIGGDEVPEEEKEILTYFDVFVNALNGILPGEPVTGEIKNKIFQITKKIYANKEPNLTPDQCILIKERVGKAYAPVIVGRVNELIDGEAGSDESEKASPDQTPVN